MTRVSLRVALFKLAVTALVGVLLNLAASLVLPAGLKGWTTCAILTGFVLITGGMWMGEQQVFQRHFYRRMREDWEKKVGRAGSQGERTAVVSLLLPGQTISLEYALETCPVRLLFVPVASQAMRDELCARAVRCYTHRPGKVCARIGALPVLPLRLTPQIQRGIRADLDAEIESIFSHDSRKMIDAAIHYLQEGRHCVALFVDADHMTEAQLAKWLGTEDPDWCWRVLIMVAPGIEAEVRQKATAYPTACIVAAYAGCEQPLASQESTVPQVHNRVRQCVDDLVETLCQLEGIGNKLLGRRLLERCALAFLLAEDADAEAWLYPGALLETGVIEEPALFLAMLGHLHEFIEHNADGVTVRWRRNQRPVWDFLLAAAIIQAKKSTAEVTPAQWRTWHDAPQHVYLRPFLDILAECTHPLAQFPASPFHRLIHALWINAVTLDTALLSEVAITLPSGQPAFDVADQCRLWSLLLASDTALSTLVPLVEDLPAVEKVMAVLACASPDRRLQVLRDVITNDELFTYFNAGNGIAPDVPAELRQRRASEQVARMGVLMMMAPYANPVPDALGDAVKQAVAVRPFPVPVLATAAFDQTRLVTYCQRFHLIMRENVLYPQS
jgi:hypothetical protein